MASAEELLEAIRDQGERGIALVSELQAVAAAQREANRIAIERLGAAQGSDPPAVAGTGETAPPASSHAPDTLDPKYSYEHGNHVPSGATNQDPLRFEKEVMKTLGDERLDPYERAVDDQLDDIADRLVTPLLDTPARFNGYDAYTRGTNVLMDAYELCVDKYRQEHEHWATAGGPSPNLFTHKGITTKQGIAHEQACQTAWEEVLKKYDELHPVLPVYKQDMMIPDPLGTVLVDRDREPRRRKKAWPHEEVLKPPEGAADPEGFREDRVTENIPMLISNDPTQYPYRGTFAAQRALDKYGYLNRDLAYGTILMKFSEQGHVGRPDFKSYQAIHDIDVTRCDSISYNIVRLLKEEFPTFNSDVAQSLRQQYEGAKHFL